MQMAPSREDLAEALEQVDEGKIPKDSLTLQMLYEEMIRWPNLELSIITLFQSLYPNPYIISYISDKVEVSKKQPRDSNVEWDSAAAIEEADVDDDDTGVASKAMGYWSLVLSLVISSYHRYLGCVNPVLQFPS
ncbi:unnamed protein product, partial [Brassica rapa]